jgi:hypothetical protein
MYTVSRVNSETSLVKSLKTQTPRHQSKVYVSRVATVIVETTPALVQPTVCERLAVRNVQMGAEKQVYENADGRCMRNGSVKVTQSKKKFRANNQYSAASEIP